ncbi:NfeD family protein [Thalassospira profundimaris]|uniref:NfeD family protein n=1 Tax=Thalassospira profundimaris TaxID=502049 RepID=UPI0011BDDBD8|nr:NfeD family protein [Thalassospira profundimaris]
MDFLFSAGMTYWHWWSLAAVLLVLEITAPGVFFLWLAFAAALTGFAKLFFAGLSLEIQLLVFALCGVVATFAGRRWLVRRTGQGPDDEQVEDLALNQREAQLRGRIITLPHDVSGGETRVMLDGTTWRLHVEQPLPAGQKVRITAIKGTVLQGETVEKA